MGAILEVTTNKREDYNETVLGRKFQAHVEVVLKEFVIETNFDKRGNKAITNDCPFQ